MTLTPQQKADLLFLYEEEKLARDVYANFEDMYNHPLFSKIKNINIDTMITLLHILKEYRLDSTISDFDNSGTFKNEVLQNDYYAFIEQGSDSIVSALNVGKKLELHEIDALPVFITRCNFEIRRILATLLTDSFRHFDELRDEIDNHHSVK